MIWSFIKYEDLTRDELYQILHVRNEVFVVEQNCAYLDTDEYDKQSIHVIGKKHDEIAAYARIIPAGIKYQEASIGRVLTTSKYRGLTIGQELMKQSVSYIEVELKEHMIRLPAQVYLRKFYESFGFKAVSKEYLEDDILHVDMLYQSFI